MADTGDLKRNEKQLLPSRNSQSNEDENLVFLTRKKNRISVQETKCSNRITYYKDWRALSSGAGNTSLGRKCFELDLEGQVQAQKNLDSIFILDILWHLTLWEVSLFLNCHLLRPLMETHDSCSLAALPVCSCKVSLLLTLQCRCFPSQSLRPAADLLWFQPSNSQNLEVRITWRACEKCRNFWHQPPAPALGCCSGFRKMTS